MQKFKYKAVTVNRTKYEGTFLAEDMDDLRVQLAKQSLYLISAKPVSDQSPNPFFSVSGKVKTAELTSFCRQFSIMINSSIAIVDSLSILRKQNYSGYFRKILDLVYEDVGSGMLLSEAMKKHKRVFPNFFHSMVFVGEMSGGLDKVLTSLADYYETDANIKRKIVGALTYPIMLMVMIVAVLVIMMVFVVPTFRDTLEDLDVEMPALTQVVFDLSDWLLVNYLNLAAGIIVAVGVIALAIRSKKGRYVWDMMKMKLPFLGTINVNVITSRVARGLGILLDSGMDIMDSMEVIQRVLGNAYVEAKFADAITSIKKGSNISLAFGETKVFPDILLQMIAVGERTGSLSEVLLRSCKFFDEKIEASLMALTAILQPVMLLIMGGTVGVIFIAIYSPMLAIMEAY